MDPVSKSFKLYLSIENIPCNIPIIHGLQILDNTKTLPVASSSIQHCSCKSIKYSLMLFARDLIDIVRLDNIQ